MSDLWITPVRLTVGKGISKQHSEHEWTKIYYQLDLDVTGAENVDEINSVREKAEKILDHWLKKPERFTPSPEATRHAQELAGIPDIDIADVEELPWWMGPRQTGRASKEQEKGWIMADPDKNPTEFRETLARLNDAIRKAKGTFELGEYTYSFSGAQSQYINRKPRKP